MTPEDMLAAASAATGLPVSPAAPGFPGFTPTNSQTPFVVPTPGAPGAAAPAVDYSAQAAALLSPGAAQQAPAPGATLPPGITPDLLAVSQNIVNKYGSAAAFDQALAQSQIEEAKKAAETETAQQWLPAYDRIAQMEQSALSLADEADHATIRSNAEQARLALDAQLASAVMQAQQLAVMMPTFQRIQAEQERTQHEMQITGQVQQVLAQSPVLASIPGMDMVLRNSILAGNDPQAAVAQALQMASNLNVRAAQGGAPLLPSGTPYGLPPGNVAPGQQATINIPNPTTHPREFAAFEQQMLAMAK